MKLGCFAVNCFFPLFMRQFDWLFVAVSWYLLFRVCGTRSKNLSWASLVSAFQTKLPVCVYLAWLLSLALFQKPVPFSHFKHAPCRHWAIFDKSTLPTSPEGFTTPASQSSQSVPTPDLCPTTVALSYPSGLVFRLNWLQPSFLYIQSAHA